MAERSLRERKKEETRNKILDVSQELIQLYSFEEMTMQMIADKAGIALRTLYNYFPTKESMIASYIHTSIKQEQEKDWGKLMNISSTYSRLVFLCRRSAEWVEKNAAWTRIYTEDSWKYIFGPLQPDIPRSGLEELVQMIIIDGQKRGDLLRHVSSHVLTRNFLSVFHFCVIAWLNDTSQDLFELLMEGFDLFFTGAGAVSSGRVTKDIFI